MTEEPENESTEQRPRPEWIDEAEEALERAGDALRTAWEETRDSRMNALGSAKQAAKQLADAIDRGVDAARTRWQAAGETEEAPPPPEQESASEQPTDADEEE